MRALRFGRATAVCLVAVGGMMFGVAGCGSSGDSATPAATVQADPDAATPQLAVQKWLAAVKSGDDKTAETMLTPLALEKTKAMDVAVAPPGSDTATFAVGEVEMVAEDGAHVASTWTDIDEQGQPHSDSIIWMLRKEERGWRIAGMAAILFPGEPPIFLNFEDPEDMVRKQELAMQEMERRANEAAAQKLAPANTAAAPGAVAAPGMQAPAGVPAGGVQTLPPAATIGTAPPAAGQQPARQAQQPGQAQPRRQ